MTSPDQSFLMGGGGPKSAFNKYDKPGTVKGGRILSWEHTQQREMDEEKSLKFWKDGNPMMQLEITVQTDERNPEIDNDNGERRLFVKGKMTAAVRAAVKAASREMIELGGILMVQYQGDEAPKVVGQNGAKIYAAHYTPAPIGYGQTEGASEAALTFNPAAVAAPAASPMAEFVKPATPGASIASATPAAAPPAVQPSLTFEPAASPHADEQAAVNALVAGGLVAAGSPAHTAPGASVASATPVSTPPADLVAALAALSPEERRQMGLPG